MFQEKYRIIKGKPLCFIPYLNPNSLLNYKKKKKKKKKPRTHLHVVPLHEIDHLCFPNPKRGKSKTLISNKITTIP